MVVWEGGGVVRVVPCFQVSLLYVSLWHDPFPGGGGGTLPKFLVGGPARDEKMDPTGSEVL